MPACASTSGYNAFKSLPGQTTQCSARRRPRLVVMCGKSMLSTGVFQKKSTPRLCASQWLRRGMASRDSTRHSCGLCKSAMPACSQGQSRAAVLALSMLQPWPISVAIRPCKTATASGRWAIISRPSCTSSMPAWGATSRQIAAVSFALCQCSPRRWPVTVMKPKLRTEAPMALALRSTTATRRPRCRAVQAVARPTMPAPTTTKS